MTNPAPHRHTGGCHCGNLTYIFETTAGFEKLGLRMCACSFCRKHGQRSASDPNGSIKLSVKDKTKLHRYLFGLKTTDFLICRDCGIYIGAMLQDKVGAWMVTNVNTLTDRPPPDFPATLHNFDSETYESRIDRRKKVWTPVVEKLP